MADQNLQKEEIELVTFEYREGVTDVIIRVKQKDFHVNKGVLMVASPVFEKLMTQEFKEKATGVVEIKGTAPSDVEEFLKCIYPNIKVEMSDDVVDKVLPLAHEYQVSTLLAECEDYLLKKYFTNKYPYSTNPTTEKLARFLWYGITFHLNRLKDKSVMVLALCTVETFINLKQFTALPSDLQNHVVMQRVKAFEFFTTRSFVKSTDFLQNINLVLKEKLSGIVGIHRPFSKSIWDGSIPFPVNNKWS